jgi:outer membrane protein OmpA-like peptidoglycan-associated protein
MIDPLSGGLMLKAKRTLPVALTIAAGLLWQNEARAQNITFYMDRAQISGAPDDGYMVWRPYLHEKTRFYGMLSLGYTHNPLRKEAATGDSTAQQGMPNLVTGQFLTYLNIGTEVSGWFGFNVSQPISLYTMYGDQYDSTVDNRPDFTANERMGLHDTRFDLRVKAYQSNDRKLRLGAGTAIFLPTGNSAGALAGDDQTSAYLFVSGEYNFGSWLLAGNLGPHFRPNRGFVSSQSNDINTLSIGNELRWSFGGYVPLRDETVVVGLELWGTTGMQSVNGTNTFFAGQNTDVEWTALGKMKLDRKGHWWAQGGLGTRVFTNGYGSPDLRVLASLGYWFTVADKAPPSAAPRYDFENTKVDKEEDRDGDGYPDSIDKCPDIKEDKREPNPTDGCPADADRDGDGIPDSVDACPDVKEDKDGVADQDGCPEEDADSDGIADGKDKCPMNPGLESKIAEKNGCPSLTRFNDDGEIQLLEPIQFDTGKATIKAVSFPILDEVVALMKARKDLKVGVYGHTDSVGSDANNLKLSKDRAAACMKYLVDHGITASRLQSEGFGESKPITTNDTPDGRAKNRRTEFKVLD